MFWLTTLPLLLIPQVHKEDLKKAMKSGDGTYRSKQNIEFGGKAKNEQDQFF